MRTRIALCLLAAGLACAPAALAQAPASPMATRSVHGQQ